MNIMPLPHPLLNLNIEESDPSQLPYTYQEGIGTRYVIIRILCIVVGIETFTEKQFSMPTVYNIYLIP